MPRILFPVSRPLVAAQASLALLLLCLIQSNFSKVLPFQKLTLPFRGLRLRGPVAR